MIKHLYQQIIKKRRRYYISAIVLFLSFFVLLVIVGFIYPDMIKSCSLKLPVEPNNRVELFIRWKSSENETHKSIKAQLKESVLKLNGALAADYVINDLGTIHTIHAYDRYSNNTYFISCGENFTQVFDLKMEQGKWFTDTGNLPDRPPVVITRNHADYLGIQTITPNSIFTTINLIGNKKDSASYQVVGIVGNIGNVRNMRSQSELEKNIFPVFSPGSLYENKYNFDERLILKMQDGYDFDLLNTQILNLMEKLNIGEYVCQHRLTSLNDVLAAQIKEHFSKARLFYGILLILLTYIFVALFGNFWKITSKRTVEIGIRRALGHSRGKVVFYILAESLLLLATVMLPATIVYLNLYKIINIAAPLPVYLISAGILLFIVLLATLVPAIRAGRIHPVEALAEE
jgi:hypothetical protein